MVTAAVAMLGEDPAIDAVVLARRFDVGLGRFARVFKAEMGMSLVEYRNRVRLDRFDALLGEGNMSLFEAALAAGFGSYAQFHRVFRKLRGVTPREYVRRSD
jgi:transcriptional regulator GlxA family with amidase domain